MFTSSANHSDKPLGLEIISNNSPVEACTMYSMEYWLGCGGVFLPSFGSLFIENVFTIFLSGTGPSFGSGAGAGCFLVERLFILTGAITGSGFFISLDRKRT